jgi:hypothetical protein
MDDSGTNHESDISKTYITVIRILYWTKPTPKPIKVLRVQYHREVLWQLLGEEENKVPILGIIAATAHVGRRLIMTNKPKSQRRVNFAMSVWPKSETVTVAK